MLPVHLINRQTIKKENKDILLRRNIDNLSINQDSRIFPWVTIIIVKKMVIQETMEARSEMRIK